MDSLAKRMGLALYFAVISLSGAMIIAALEILDYLNPSGSSGQIALLVVQILTGFLIGSALEPLRQKIAAILMVPVLTFAIFVGVALLPLWFGVIAGPFGDALTLTVLQDGLIRLLFLFIPVVGGCLLTLMIHD